jgi:hypothetical protein
MYFSLKEVQPLPDYRLLLTFENSEHRIFDMSPYLTRGIFRELSDNRMSQSVRISFDTVEWANGADMDPETLYLESENANDSVKNSNYSECRKSLSPDKIVRELN